MFGSFFMDIVRELLVFLGYVAGKSSFPLPLNEEEEKLYIERMQKGDQNARNKLIEHNMRLVAHVVRKYSAPGKDNGDLISVGSIGLIKAVNSFNPENGTQLATFAAKCIDNEILMLFRSSKKIRKDVSLNEPIGVDKDGNEITVIDLLGSRSGQVEDDVERKIDYDKAITLIKKLLNERERLVIEMRFGLVDGVYRPQHEIAKILNISRSYISRIEKQALVKIRQNLAK